MKSYTQKTKRGESWDAIEGGLQTLIRRMAADRRALDEMQLVYDTIEFVARYKHEKQAEAHAKLVAEHNARQAEMKAHNDAEEDRLFEPVKKRWRPNEANR